MAIEMKMGSGDQKAEFCVCALLIIQFLLCTNLIRNYSVTQDEAAHLPAGLAFWLQGDVSRYHVNPPLAKSLSSIPVILFDHFDYLPLGHDYGAESRQEFLIANDFAMSNRNDFHALIYHYRLAGLGWLGLGGVLIWRLARHLAGNVGGVVAVAFWVTDPMITSHGALGTPDIPGTVMALSIVCAAYFLSAQNSTGVRTVLIVSAIASVAVMIKFTNLLMAIWIVPFFIYTAFTKKCSIIRRLMLAANYIVLSVLVALLIFWLVYLFDGWGTRFRDLKVQSLLFGQLTSTLSSVEWMPCPLPPQMVLGLDTQQLEFEGIRTSFLHGVSRQTGWAYYYLIAWLYKSPVGILSGISVAFCMLVFRRWRPSDGIWFFVIFPLLTFLGPISLKSGYTNHLRYALPCFPFLFVLASSCLQFLRERPSKLTPVIYGAIALGCMSVSFAFPHWLGYFNELAGGRAKGWEQLDDSNVGWGQDLIYLRNWIDRNALQQQVYLVCSHSIDPTIYVGPCPPSIRDSKYVAMDAYTLTHNFEEYRNCRIVERVGASFFIFSTQDVEAMQRKLRDYPRTLLKK